MPAPFKDYYASLDLKPEASEDAIKKSFRHLALIYHPDVARNKKSGEAMFKEINEAYEVLGDPDKRRMYDRLYADRGPRINFATGTSGQPSSSANPTRENSRQHTPPKPRPSAFSREDFSDFYEEYFGGGRTRPGTNRPPESSDVENQRRANVVRRWLYRNSENGLAAGPFDLMEMAALIRCRDINGSTSTQLEGEMTWKPFQERPEFEVARGISLGAIRQHLDDKAERAKMDSTSLWHHISTFARLAAGVFFFGFCTLATGIGKSWGLKLLLFRVIASAFRHHN